MSRGRFITARHFIRLMTANILQSSFKFNCYEIPQFHPVIDSASVDINPAYTGVCIETGPQSLLC